jgi:hypothetical protein
MHRKGLSFLNTRSDECLDSSDSMEILVQIQEQERDLSRASPERAGGVAKAGIPTIEKKSRLNFDNLWNYIKLSRSRAEYIEQTFMSI